VSSLNFIIEMLGWEVNFMMISTYKYTTLHDGFLSMGQPQDAKVKKIFLPPLPAILHTFLANQGASEPGPAP